MNYDYKYRLYPTPEQENAMESTLDTCRQLYNHLLEDVKHRGTPVPPKYELQKELPQLKSEWEELDGIHSRVIQMVLHRLYNNFESVTRPFEDEYNIERLRFKGEGWYKTFTYHQSGFNLQVDDSWLDSLYLSKIGHVPIRYHRELPEGAEIKQIKIKREADGKWFAILGIEVDDEVDDMPSTEEDVVTIGAGIQSYSIDSDGLAVNEPSYEELQRERTRAKDKLSRKSKGSSSYEETREELGEIDKKIDRKQKDFLHKLSTHYVEQYDVIVVESRYLGRRNSSWWEFVNMLEYKAESASTLLVQVDPDESATCTCSECGTESSEQYWLREQGCPTCGESVQRSQADLERIHKSAPENVGLGKAELKPVDMIATVSDIESFAGGMAEAGSPPS